MQKECFLIFSAFRSFRIFVFHLFSLSNQKRKIRLEFDLTPSSPVLVNRNKLIQIFINIIKNAYEAIDAASPENEGKISIAKSLEKKEETEYVEIMISDTDVGVPAEAAEKVFRFSYSTKERGSGFGLHDAANYNYGSKRCDPSLQ